MSSKFELSLSELDELVKILPKQGVILLRGNLGAGKTALAKKIVEFTGNSDAVTSPTFSVMQSYGNVFHYDLYRVGLENIKLNGLFENFFEDGIHIVEWGNEELEKLLKKYGIQVCIVEISGSGENRTYEVSFA